MDNYEVEYSMEYYYDDWSDNRIYRHLIKIRPIKYSRWLDFESRLVEPIISEMTEWCGNNNIVEYEISKSNSAFYFQHKEDAMAFKLRWA